MERTDRTTGRDQGDKKGDGGGTRVVEGRELERIIYKGWFIEVTKLPTGSWMVVVEASPGKADPVGKFDSQEAAVKAAKRYIDDQRLERRGQP